MTPQRRWAWAGAAAPVIFALALDPVASLLAPGRAGPLERMRDLIDVERSLGLFVEPSVHAWVAARPLVLDALEVTYVGVHVPVMLAVLAWVWFAHPQAFPRARNTFVAAQTLCAIAYPPRPPPPPAAAGGRGIFFRPGPGRPPQRPPPRPPPHAAKPSAPPRLRPRPAPAPPSPPPRPGGAPPLAPLPVLREGLAPRHRTPTPAPGGVGARVGARGSLLARRAGAAAGAGGDRAGALRRMCRLFGMSGGDRRVRATFWLLEAPDSLARQSRREPDGTGVGWFDEDGRPQVAKQPLAAYEDPAFAREARELESTVFLAHIRYATTGEVDVRNTHPFEQRGRLFAHNGVILELERLERELGDDRALVRGDTDSERLFALITRETERHGGDVGAGIAAAARWVAAEHCRCTRSTSSSGRATACGRCATPRRTSCGCSSATPADRAAVVTSTRPAPPAPCACARSPSRATRRSSSPASAWTRIRAGACSSRVS